MKTKMEQFPAKNPNPVLSVAYYGTVLYSNKAGEPLLREWGIEVREKLPSDITEIVQRVITLNSPEKMEVKAGNRIYLISFHPLPEGERVNIYGFDISDQKEFEGKLRESEEKYRDIIETAIEGIWILDSGFRTSYVNKKMADMLGYSQEEMIDRFPWDFTDEEEKAVIKLNMEKRRQGVSEIQEIKFIRSYGSPLWAQVSSKSLYDKNGNFTGALGMLTDITERKQEEQKLCRSNKILEGINQIFNNVVQAKTEEELGEACLSVALEITGSAFGFINVMGAEGLLNDVAKSQLGWERCLMEDKTEHGNLQNSFIVHGLYGSVIINEKSFFTNDPQSHPDSIGVPPGNPPIKSLLGVPLVQDGITVGLIAVANREGGYCYEQQEDLEAIAPAVIQVLQRKKSEEALRLSNLYNRRLIEVSLDPLVTIGHDGKIMDVNLATEEVTGCSRNELIGTDFSDYFAEPEKAKAGYQQVFTEGKVWDYPLEIQHRDGHITPVLYNASVYRDKNGEVIGVFAAARDITERKRTEKALKKAYDSLEEKVKERTAELEEAYNSLKESEKGLAEAQQMAHIGNWVWDIKTDSAYWSDELYRIFGRDPQKLAPPYKEYLSYIHPDDRDIAEIIHKEAVNGEAFKMDRRIVLDDGEVRLIHMQTEIIFDEKNIPIKLKGTIQDITERKRAEEKLQESEEKYRNIVETTNEGISLINGKGIITYLNRQMADILGYTIEEIIGKKIWDFVKKDDESNVTLNLEKRRRGINANYEIQLIRKDGSPIWVLISSKPIFDNNGKFMGALNLHTDINERKKAEEALRNFEIARQKEIHHRIKNNLQVISSLLDLQADKFTNRGCIKDSEVLEAFRESQDRVTTMALVHEELYKGGGFETLNFSPYIEELAENLFKTYNIGNNDIRLKLDLSENTFFDMDIAVPLGMIVNELVTNSFKHAFSGRDKGEIRIRLHKEESEDCIRAFILAVSDDGIGIPEGINIENLDSLGLQLVTTLVEQLDGELELRRDNGTEFIIRFTVTENKNPASQASPQ